jgi:Uma2 family endonuclease
MKTISTPKLSRIASRSRLAPMPTSRHVPGVWEAGARSLKPRGRFWTDEELLALGANTDVKYELCDGKIIAMPPAKPKHGAVIMQLAYYMAVHVFEHKLGKLFDGQTGFRLGRDHCYEPDISFVSNERMKLILPPGGLDGLFQAAPDIAVEVLSPSDSITKTERRMHLYLSFGARRAWMIDPKSKTVRVYRPGEEFELLRGERMLTGNSVLPGFRVSLVKIFEGI